MLIPRGSLYRSELKFLIPRLQASLVLARARTILARDGHVVDGRKYRVTSLYFDDYHLSSYFDKLNGENLRAKYRLRCYNLDRHVLKFEHKSKIGGQTYKQVYPVSQAAYPALLRGEFSPTVVGAQLAGLARANLLRPKIIVDYQRTPLIYADGLVRLTVDEHVRYTTTNYDLFTADNYYQFWPAETVILEVKYLKFLPRALVSLLSQLPLRTLSVSKYALCLQQARCRYQLLG